MKRTLENVRSAMQRAAVTVARWGVARMIHETAGRRVDATTHFKRQWKVVKFPGGAATANTAPYASFVEAGRGSGRRPPLEAIEKWILAKGIAPPIAPQVSRGHARGVVARAHRITGSVYSGKARREMRANMRLYAKVYRSKPARANRAKMLVKAMALGIARKIARKGTKPKWLLRDVLDDFRREARSQYNAAVRKVARNPLARVSRAS